MEEEEELVERQQLQKKRRTEQLLTSGEVMSIFKKLREPVKNVLAEFVR